MRPRRATIADLPDVEALLRICALTVDDVNNEAVQFHVSRDRTGLLGCAGVEEISSKVAVLRVLAVTERARRSGLAGLLLSTLIVDMRLRGIESILVMEDCAANYFARFGFTPAERESLPVTLLNSSEFSNVNVAEMGAMRVDL